MLKKFVAIAAITTVASIAQSNAAHAIGFSYSSGTYRQDALGKNITTEGAFSTNYNARGFTTFDFNDGKVPGNDMVKYTFSKGTYSTQALSRQTGIYADKWAPAGPKAEVNKSNYLAVFQDSFVTIEHTKGQFFNYFGFDAGALSKGNTLKFFNGNTLVKEFTYDIMTKLAPVVAQQHGGEKNGFFEFFSESNTDNFNRIVLSQSAVGGFESDNHTFRISKGKYNSSASVPEPGLALGLLAVGGFFLRQRKNEKSTTGG